MQEEKQFHPWMCSRPCLYADYGHHNTVKFGLQHPNFNFDFRNHDTSQIVDSL